MQESYQNIYTGRFEITLINYFELRRPIIKGITAQKAQSFPSEGDGSIVFYAGYKTEEHWVTESGLDFKDNVQVRAPFQPEFMRWGLLWSEFFENFGSSFVPCLQNCLPFVQTRESLSNLTMLGDGDRLMAQFAR
jgi:hypothetical protein